MKFALVYVYESTSIDSEIEYTWHANLKSHFDNALVDKFRGSSNPSLTNTLMAAISVAKQHGCDTARITYHSESGRLKKLDYRFSFGGITLKKAGLMAQKLIHK